MSDMEIIELELPDDLIAFLALEAHRQDITLNQHINNILRKALEHFEWDNGIVTFDAAYDRTGTISAELDTCHRCKQEKLCISIDSSDGEYGPGNICLECATDMLSQDGDDVRIGHLF